MPSPQISPTSSPFGGPNHDESLSRDPRKSSPDSLKFDPARSLGEFASNVTSIAAISVERERLKKRSQAESTDLRKASDRNFQYPSVAKRLKTGKEELDNELVRVDEKLKIHQKMQQELIKGLAANFMSSQQQAQHRVEIEDMKNDLREIKSELYRVANLQAGITPTLDSLKSSIQSNDNLIADIEQWKSSIEMELKNVRSELSTKQNDHKNATESVVTSQSKSIEQKECQQEQTLDSNLKFAKDESKLEPSAKAHERDSSKRLDTLDRVVSEHAKTGREVSEGAESLMYSHSEPITDGCPQFGTPAEVMIQLQNLRQIQDAKDEAIADELDKYESRIARLEEVMSKLKQMDRRNETNSQTVGTSMHQMNAELEQLRQAINGLSQHVNNRFQLVENQSRTLQAHQIALNSLETRYNHLSTEPIVKQMVIAMQEMYPHASLVQQEIPIIHDKLNRLTSALDSVRSDISAAENTRSALISDMTAERDRMAQEIISLTSKIEELGSVQSKLNGIEKVLRSRMDEVENVVATNLASVMLNVDKRLPPQNP
ncbi:hypothetical protein I7I51_02118 [Histoplasma capsulatum]|uniref:Uncharacterized protein n=1 Tax=Ajellomyces capsulatus TaxID=5037 RepID=A0A8A1M8S9_AJECA|nr:predicted protein [Histoplasma mississippiense (nom. inval.)]EDN04218.1 predicted protein [Histoplasma mississippiense (nom. inval.)]QSS62381.1 hypothetical protein I7I51_02118 [Histoplasma capsulatum]